MLDINKLLNLDSHPQLERGVFLDDIDPWDIEWARCQAATEELPLGPAHMEVLRWLRARHARLGPARSARVLLRSLEMAFRDLGGRRYLYQLFPRGPITQGCRLAGLPIPPGNADPSFGTRH
jgi:tRNA 2-thiouridine synthesizing protein E